MHELSMPPKFIVLEQQYEMPEDGRLPVFFISEVMPNPNGRKVAVPVEIIEETLQDMTEEYGENLRYAVLFDPRVEGGKRDGTLIVGWDTFNQPIQPKLSFIRAQWRRDSVVIMTFQPIAQALATRIDGQVVAG